MGEGRCYGWVDPVAWSSADVRGLARSAAGRSLRALKARSLCPHPARPPHASTRAGSRFVCMGHCAAMAGRSFRRRRPAARVRSLRALRKLPPEDRPLRAPSARSATACVRILRALRRLRPERVRAAARAVRRRPMRQNGKSRPQARQASSRRRRTGWFDVADVGSPQPPPGGGLQLAAGLVQAPPLGCGPNPNRVSRAATCRNTPPRKSIAGF